MEVDMNQELAQGQQQAKCRILCIYVSREDMKVVREAEELVERGEFKSLSQMVLAGLDVILGSMRRRRGRNV